MFEGVYYLVVSLFNTPATCKAYSEYIARQGAPVVSWYLLESYSGQLKCFTVVKAPENQPNTARTRGSSI